MYEALSCPFIYKYSAFSFIFALLNDNLAWQNNNYLPHYGSHFWKRLKLLCGGAASLQF